MEDHPERPPAGQSLAFLLTKVGFDTGRAFSEALAPLGLVPRQFGLLNHVAGAEGRTQAALVEALGIPASRMVALVDDLEERGLVERRRNPTDRRARALHLTAEGRRLLTRARRRAAQFDRELRAGLDPAEAEQLAVLLRRLAVRQPLPLGVHPGLAAPTPPGGRSSSRR